MLFYAIKSASSVTHCNFLRRGICCWKSFRIIFALLVWIFAPPPSVFLSFKSVNHGARCETFRSCLRSISAWVGATNADACTVAVSFHIRDNRIFTTGYGWIVCFYFVDTTMFRNKKNLRHTTLVWNDTQLGRKPNWKERFGRPHKTCNIRPWHWCKGRLGNFIAFFSNTSLGCPTPFHNLVRKF